MVLPLYRIVDWDTHFENNRTRELKYMNWVPIPRKLDGDGYSEMVDRPNGASVYGCWIACVIIAARCDPRGTLVRDSATPPRDSVTPHTAATLGRISRLPEASMQEMLDVAKAIGWIEVIEMSQEGAGMSQEGAEKRRLPNPNPKPKPKPNPKAGGGRFNPAALENPFSEKYGDECTAFDRAWCFWIKHRREIRKPLTETSASAQLAKLAQMDMWDAIEMIDRSIENGWQGLFESRGQANGKGSDEPAF